MTAAERESAGSATQIVIDQTARLSSVWFLQLFGISITGAIVLAASQSIHSGILLVALFTAWRWLPAPFVFAIGMIGVSTTMSVATPRGALGTLALWSLLIPKAVVTSRAREIGWLVVTTLLFGTMLVVGLRSDMSLFTVALVGAVSSALIYYVLHRYEKVRLGLVRPSQ